MYSGLKDNPLICIKLLMGIISYMQETFGFGSRNPGSSFHLTVNCFHFYLNVFQIPLLQMAELTVHLFNQQTLTGHILGVRVSVRLSR